MEVISCKQENLKTTVLSRLNELGIKPNKNIGQHFLIAGSLVNQISEFVIPGNNVIEIGAGGWTINRSISRASWTFNGY